MNMRSKVPVLDGAACGIRSGSGVLQIVAAIAVAFLFFLLMSSPAFAQIAPTPGGSFTAMDTEGAFQLFGDEFGDPFSSTFLNQIFGPLFPSVAGASQSTVFSSIVGYFNIILLVVGGIMFFANITTGVMQSAHEGQVLGRQWSSLWAPIRLIFAVGLMVPMPGLGGYNLAQAGVAYIVKGSTAIASTIWEQSAALVISGSTPITAAPPSLSPDFLKTMYLNEACKRIVSYQMSQSATDPATALRLGQTITEVDGRQTVMSVLVDDGKNTQAGICGSYQTPTLPDYLTRLENPDVVESIPLTQQSQILAAFVGAHRQSMDDLQVAMATMTTEIMPTMRDSQAALPDISTNIARAKDQADTDLQVGIEQVMDLAVGADRTGQAARDALINRISGDCIAQNSDFIGPSSVNSGAIDEANSTKCYGEGWIGAGSWYMLMAQLNNEVMTLTEAKSTANSGDYINNVSANNRAIYIASGGQRGWTARGTGEYMESAGLISEDEATLLMARFEETYETSVQGLAALGFPMTSENLSSLNEDVTDANGIISKIPGMTAAQTAFSNAVIEYTSPGNWSADPMVGLTVLGKLLINMAGLFMLVAVAGGFFTGGGLPIMALPFVSVLLTAGGVLSFILPMTPFIFWILAVTGYFLLVVEAVIAVNLWALAHMRMDGDGISGQAGKDGWMMLFSLLMTPVLMVFGFLVGMTIFRVSSKLIDLGIHQAMSGIMGGGPFVQLVGTCIFGILIASIYMVLLERSFSLVSEFPGRVLRWIGASAQLTNGEEDRARLAAGGAAAAVYKGTSQMAGAGQAAGSGKGGIKELTRDKMSRKSISNGAPKAGG